MGRIGVHDVKVLRINKNLCFEKSCVGGCGEVGKGERGEMRLKCKLKKNLT